MIEIVSNGIVDLEIKINTTYINSNTMTSVTLQDNRNNSISKVNIHIPAAMPGSPLYTVKIVTIMIEAATTPVKAANCSPC